MRYGPMKRMWPRLMIIRGSFCCQRVAELQFELLTLIAAQLQVTATFCPTVKKKKISAIWKVLWWCMFVVWSVSAWPNSFCNQWLLELPDQTAAATKHLEPAQQNGAFFPHRLSHVCACLPFCLCTGALSLKSWALAYFSEDIRLLILLVFERLLTSLPWTLAVYPGNVPPCTNSPLLAGVSRPWRLAWLLSAR